MSLCRVIVCFQYAESHTDECPYAKWHYAKWHFKDFYECAYYGAIKSELKLVWKGMRRKNTQHNDIEHYDTQHNDTPHNDTLSLC